MRYLSVCSGIEAASVAWSQLGWMAVAFAEIEAFPSAVLSHHYPDVPNWGDLTRFKDWPDATVDLLVGGTPCQSFSVAGLRQGLDDQRGNLALTYLAVADRYRPRWVVWENVPGALSVDEGRAIGAFLGGLSELGYGWAYRSLDAQYFGLAQRRRRVFVVGHLGDWRRAAAVLFERESLSGHPAPGHETQQAVAGSLGAGSTRSGGQVGRREAAANHLVARERERALTGSNQRNDYETETLIVAHALRADGFDASEDGTGRGTPIVPIDLRQASRGEKITNNRAHGSGGAPGHGVGEAGSPAFTVSERGQAVAFDARQSDVIQYGEKTGPLDTDGFTMAVAFQEAQTGVREYQSAGSLRANGPGHDPVGTRIREGMQVRRLTPRECERLQGFPDDYTWIPYRGKPAKDGPRYKALGNSMAVPCMAWIGRRIALMEQIAHELTERSA